MTDNAALQTAQLLADHNHTDLLLEITRRFTSTLDLREVLDQVLNLTVEAVGAERGSIFVLDGTGCVTHKILARWYLPPAQSEEVISVVLRQGAAGYVFRTREPVLVGDTQADERWVHLPDDPHVTRSALCVPLVHRGQLNGILTLTHAAPRHFDRHDLTLTTHIAGQAAIAIENACLYDRVCGERATLQAVIGSVVEGIVITDVQGRIEYANPAGAAALGAHIGTIHDQHLDELSPDPRLGELFRALLSARELQRGQMQGQDGRVYEASLVMAPGAGVVTTFHDVTHFVQLNALKSEFVSTVSHDLKAPLGLIYGYAWLLAENPELGAESRRYVNMILDGIQRMQQLITALLDLTLIESGTDRERGLVELADLIRESLSAFSAKIKEKGLRVDLCLDPTLPMVRVHTVRVGQALTNLINNAIKYTPAGGRIAVSTHVEEDEIVVRVSDTGPGIPSDKQAGLFGKFYRVGSKETLANEGHGLGLAIVKSVAEAHGGRVGVESVSGRGTTFVFALPVGLAVDLLEPPPEHVAISPGKSDRRTRDGGV
jgi:signal transduction histidine kinase